MKLTVKERRALRLFLTPPGERHYGDVHGRTTHALERKGLIHITSRGRVLTTTGRAELNPPPNIFDDLFPTKKKA